MGSDTFEVTVNLLKMVVIFLMMVQIVPLLVWVERRGSAFIQNRFGPNRVGPFGLTQLIADAVKFLTKEAFVPDQGRKLIYLAAPIVALVPAAIAFGAIPLSMPIELAEFTLDFSFLGMQIGPTTLGPYRFPFQSFEIGVGIVFVLGISSLGAYALLMAGWASANKYTVLGALRASAQMISYELALGLSLVGVLLLYNTFDFGGMIDAQAGPMQFIFLGKEMTFSFLPNWGLFYQPLGAFLFLVAVFAETNRLPFDLPEAEAELVAGYHTEYGGLKMNMFYIGEYGHMLVASALFATFYLGGYLIPFISPDMIRDWLLNSQGMGENTAAVVTSLILHVSLMTKIALILWLFIWVRWSLPRFRYDQLMDLGWKTMLPWALGNTIVTAIVILIMHHNWS